MKPTLSKQTILNVFEGKATPLQKKLVEQWLADSAHQELYFQWLEEWERNNLQFIPDTDEAYTRSLQKHQRLTADDSLSTSESAILPLSRRKKGYWWVAASVVLLLLSGVYALRDQLRYQHYKTAYGEIRTLTLADGSRVTLNANTVLKVPRFDFNDGPREVWLTGEAEFSVKHTVDHRRFVVRTTDQLEVQVLGTEFIVYSRTRGSKVVLNKGKVQIRSLANKTSSPLVIAPGDVVNVSKQGRLTLRHHQPLVAHAAWKEHRFVFENTPVSEIAYRLTEQFGVQVVIADTTLAQRTLGGTFKARTADELLPVLCDILNLEVNRIEGPPTRYELMSAK